MGLTRIAIGSGFNGVASGTIAIRIGNIPTPVTANIGTLTANCAARSLTCTMSPGDAGKFNVGDYVLLRSTAVFTTAPSAGAKQGEIHQVVFANWGTGVVTFDTPTWDSYTTANTATLVKETFLTHIKLSELSIVKGSGLTMGATAEVIFIACQMIDDLQMENVELVDSVTDFYGGISIDSCINSTFHGMRLIQTPSNTYNLQYGLSIGSCSQNISISDCHSFGRWRHPFECVNGKTTIGYEGAIRAVQVSNCTAQGSEVGAFDTHPDGEYISFSNCSVSGTTSGTGAGFEIRTRYTTVTGCSVTGAARGIQLSGLAHDCQIVSCSAHNCLQRGISLVSDGTPTPGILRTTIEGCDASENTGEGIRLELGCDYTTIVANTCNTNTNTGIYVVDSDHVRISNNVSTNNGNRGIFLNPATLNMNNCIVEGNSLTGNGNGTILVTEATGSFRGNSMLRNNLPAGTYNPIGTITNPWPSGTGDITNLTSVQAAPTTAVVYTNRWTPKTIVISGGTVSTIEINGAATTLTQGVFRLGIGETIKVTFSATPTVSVVRAGLE